MEPASPNLQEQNTPLKKLKSFVGVLRAHADVRIAQNLRNAQFQISGLRGGVIINNGRWAPYSGWEEAPPFTNIVNISHYYIGGCFLASIFEYE